MLAALLLLAGVLLVLVSAGAVMASDPSIVYVRASATGANDGTSWANAYTSLRPALTAAGSGQQIWVAAGTYYPGATRADTFTLKNGVAVYGGFPANGGDWADRDPSANVTTLHGDGDRNASTSGAYHLVTTTADADATAVLDGFTVRGGNTQVDANTKGGGLLVFGSPTLANLVIAENFSCYCGGGMHIEGGSPTLSGITFSENVAQWYGGGLSIRNASPTMHGIAFLDNRVSSGAYGGGGLHVVGGATTLTGAVFAGNQALYGGGLDLAAIVPGGDQLGGSGTSYPGTSILLANVVFGDNTSHLGGGGMNASGGTAALVNTDFVGNEVDGDGGGLRLGSNNGWDTTGATVAVTNSILWGNTAATIPAQIAVPGGSLTVSHSDVQGGCTGLAGVTCGPGNIQSFPFDNSGDPSVLQDIDWDGLDEMLGTADDGVRLAIGSPAVDTGSDAAVPGGAATDLIGAARIQDGDADGTASVDMGAVEAPLPVTDGVIYVDAAATGANDGTSWTDAFTDLQAGLALAAPGDSTQVWVAAGTYAPTLGRDPAATFLPRNGVTAYGGFSGTETSLEQRDPAVNVTVLSGDLSANDASAFDNPSDHVYHVVSAYSWVGDTAVFDGFTVSGGKADGDNWIGQVYGGGVYSSQGSPTLRNMTVAGNTAKTGGGGMYSAAGAPTLDHVAFTGNHANVNGGGLFVPSGAATLSDVLFEDNTTTEGFGGGLAAANPDAGEPSTPTLALTRVAFRGNVAQYGAGFGAMAGDITIRESVFEANHATYLGGGLYVGDPYWMQTYVGALSLDRVVFRGNDASNTPSGGYEGGGGMMIFDASPTLTNVVFSGNDACVDGGGLYIYLYAVPTSPALTNVTFSGNAAARGGAISADYGRATVTNSILWGDGGGEISGPVTVTYSTVQGGYAGTGNTSTDPLFLSPVSAAAAPTAAGNLRLAAGSPAVNAGSTAAVPAGVTTDLDGCARVFGAAVDKGAYERGDSRAPTTSVSGSDPLWHNDDVTLGFTATDGAGGSGVARTEYWVDDGVWTPGTSVTVAAPAGGANDGYHTVAYRSLDNYGNVENTNLCTVLIDTVAPAAADDHDGAWHPAFGLHVSGLDGRSGVDHITYTIDGGSEQVVAGDACDILLRTWKRGGNSGIHIVGYRVVDLAGNETSGSCEVLLDGKPPVTKSDAPVDASGAPVPRLGAFTVHLSAADQPGLAGLATTSWRRDDGAWQTGTDVAVPADGQVHWIAYYSTDNAGNREYTKWCPALALPSLAAKHPDRGRLKP